MEKDDHQTQSSIHYRHNSVIDFSFISDKTSSNSLPLVHLNALFEKLADRKIMGITAKKLYKLILKADVNKHKLTYYRHKLGIPDNSEIFTPEESLHSKRVISRGPFMALFKDEPIKFVNALEAAARPLFKRKKRSECRKSTSESILLSVKTEPIRSNSRINESSKDEKSPKHRKIEDKTGMIIVADVDHDEISTVSVSPTGEESVYSNQSFKTHSNDNDHFNSAKKKKKRDSTHCRSNRKSARKSNRQKRRDSLRSVKSVGNESGDASVDKSLFSCKSHDTVTTHGTTTMESSHHRSNSIQNIESIDIHGLANGNPPPFNQNATFNNNPTLHYQMYNSPHFLYQYPINDYSGELMPSFVNHGTRNIPSELENQRMNLHYPMYHPHQMCFSHHRGSHSFQMSNTIEYEECFLFKGIARFLKKCFGIVDRHPCLFAEQPIPHFPNYQAPRKQVKSMVYDDTSVKDSNLMKDLEEKLRISQSNDKSVGKEDVQRVLSFKLKVDDEEVTNRPRIYSAPDQKFLASDMNRKVTGLSSRSTQHNIHNKKNEIVGSLHKITEKSDCKKSSHYDTSANMKQKENVLIGRVSSKASQSLSSNVNERNYHQNVVPTFSNAIKSSFHHYR